MGLRAYVYETAFLTYSGKAPRVRGSPGASQGSIPVNGRFPDKPAENRVSRPTSYCTHRRANLEEKEGSGIESRRLAQIIDVNAASIGLWENGKAKPNTSSVNALTKWLERTDFNGSNKDAARSELGEAIVTKRREWDLSQGQVAQYLGVSETTLANWESNTAFPNGNNLKKVMQLLADDSFKRVAEHPKFTILGQDIKNRRKQLGMSQPELAERLDVAVGTIGRWE